MAIVSTLTDSELLSLVREGNQTAYTEVYNRYKGILFMHAYKRLQDQQEAEDTLHDIFSTLWSGLMKHAALNLFPSRYGGLGKGSCWPL